MVTYSEKVAIPSRMMRIEIFFFGGRCVLTSNLSQGSVVHTACQLAKTIFRNFESIIVKYSMNNAGLESEIFYFRGCEDGIV
jgi:hypothetical protein